jgi:DNA-binding transcriptional regulator YiaG
MEQDPVRLDAEGCAHLLHVSTGEVRDWIRRKEFAEPNGMAACT